MKYSLGRYVYGLAAIAFGVCALAWHDISNWLQIKATGDLAHSAALTSVVAVIEILGGVAVLFPRTARAGAIILGSLYFVFALLTVPFIVKQPLVYNSYGNFFEQFSFRVQSPRHVLRSGRSSATTRSVFVFSRSD